MLIDLDDRLIFIIHAVSRPKEIIISGMIFIIGGSINMLVNNIIHLIVAPVIIDINPNNMVGKMIFICSLMNINEFDRLGPHNTTKLNRTE